jgi:hypothetical protein
MYTKTEVKVPGFLEYLTALSLLNNWWEQRTTQTVRPGAEVLAMLVNGRCAEMAVRS